MSLDVAALDAAWTAWSLAGPWLTTALAHRRAKGKPMKSARIRTPETTGRLRIVSRDRLPRTARLWGMRLVEAVAYNVYRYDGRYYAVRIRVATDQQRSNP